MPIRVCMYCGKEFEAKGKQKYCSRKCMQKCWYKKSYQHKEPVINRCVYCGKEFKSKRPAKYCGQSCRAKHKRRKTAKLKYCLQCGCELEFGREKFCSKECAEQYSIANPKYKKVCAYCGKEFRTNNKKQKLCSVDCQHKYEKMRNAKEREQEFKEKFESKYPEFEYISGYIGWMSHVTIRCKRCGYEQEKSAELVRPSYEREIICKGCLKIKALRRKLINLIARKRNDIMREQERKLRKAEREATRKELLSGYVCEECGNVFDADRIGQKYCSDRCANRHNNHIKEIKRRGRLKQNGDVDLTITLEKLIKRDKNICHICGEICDESDYTIDEDGNFIVGEKHPSIDHVVPVSKGGTHTWDNVKLAHHYCNTVKSNYLVAG